MDFSEPLRCVATRLRASVDFAVAGDVPAALAATSRCHRSLLMLTEAANLLELVRQVSSDASEPWSLEKIDRLVDRVDAAEDAIVAEKGAIDHDFAFPTVRANVLPLLSAARQSALAIGGMDGPGCVASLAAAAEALSLAAGGC